MRLFDSQILRAQCDPLAKLFKRVFTRASENQFVPRIARRQLDETIPVLAATSHVVYFGCFESP
jgi:hypothetical protein